MIEASRSFVMKGCNALANWTNPFHENQSMGYMHWWIKSQYDY